MARLRFIQPGASDTICWPVNQGGSMVSTPAPPNSPFAFAASNNRVGVNVAGSAVIGETTGAMTSPLCVTFNLQVDDKTPDVDTVLFKGGSTSNPLSAMDLSLVLQTDGDLTIRDATNATVLTVTDPLSIDTNHSIKIWWERANSGDCTLTIDESANTASAQDFLAASGTDISEVSWGSEDIADATDPNITPYLSEVTVWDQVTANADVPDIIDVHRFSMESAPTTTSGDALDNGSWQNAGALTYSASTFAEYTANPAAGHAMTDHQTDGSEHAGPNGAGLGGTVLGAAWLTIAESGGGGGTTHTIRYGNSVDTINTQVVELANQDGAFFIMSEAAGAVPLLTEYFAWGMEVDGAKDFETSGAYMALAIEVSTLVEKAAADTVGAEANEGTTALEAQNATTDTIGLGASEGATAIMALLEQGDTLDTTAAGTLADLAVSLTRSDTVGIESNEAADLTAMLDATDALDVSASGTSASIVVALSQVDTIDLSLAGTSAIEAALAQGDSLGVDAADTVAAIDVSLDRADTLETAVGEGASLLASLQTADMLDAGIGDTSTSTVILQAADQADAATNEAVPTILSTLARSDTAGLSLGEQSAVEAALHATDAIDTTAADGATLSIAVLASETLALAIAETVRIDADLARTDTIDIGVADAVATLTALLAAADTLGVSFGEVGSRGGAFRKTAALTGVLDAETDIAALDAGAIAQTGETGATPLAGTTRTINLEGIKRG